MLCSDVTVSNTFTSTPRAWYALGVLLLCPKTEVQGLQVCSGNLRATLVLFAQASKITKRLRDDKQEMNNSFGVEVDGTTMRSEADAPARVHARTKVRLKKVLFFASAGFHPC